MAAAVAQPLSGPWATGFDAARPSPSRQALLAVLAILVGDAPYVCHATSPDWMQEDEENRPHIQCRPRSARTHSGRVRVGRGEQSAKGTGGIPRWRENPASNFLISVGLFAVDFLSLSAVSISNRRRIQSASRVGLALQREAIAELVTMPSSCMQTETMFRRSL